MKGYFIFRRPLSTIPENIRSIGPLSKKFCSGAHFFRQRSGLLCLIYCYSYQASQMFSILFNFKFFAIWLSTISSIKLRWIMIAFVDCEYKCLDDSSRFGPQYQWFSHTGQIFSLQLLYSCIHCIHCIHVFIVVFMILILQQILFMK